MYEENIQALRQIRADLETKLRAVNSAIELMQNIDTPHIDTADEPVEPQKKSRTKKVKSTEFESAIDLTKIADFNSHGGGIRTDV